MTSILSDSMSFKIKDLALLLKSKYAKDDITEALFSLNFVTVSDDFDHVTYDLPDSLTIISLLNIPFSLNQDELLQLLEVDNYTRFYKKSLFWLLVGDSIDIVKLTTRLKGDLIVTII
jgi:hypothetical protein